jgi:hypothetical protein
MGAAPVRLSIFWHEVSGHFFFTCGHCRNLVAAGALCVIGLKKRPEFRSLPQPKAVAAVSGGYGNFQSRQPRLPAS